MKVHQSESSHGEAIAAGPVIWLAGAVASVVGGLIVLSADGIQTVPLWVRYTSGVLFAVGLIRAWQKQTDKGLQAAVVLFSAALVSLGLWHSLDGGQQHPIAHVATELAKVIAVVFPLLGGCIAVVYPSLAGSPVSHE